VHKFGAELDGDGVQSTPYRDVLGGDAPADAVTRLDNGNVPAALGQSAAGRQTCDARTKDQGIVFNVVGPARWPERPLGSRLFH
jgi:hypothetical protein